MGTNEMLTSLLSNGVNKKSFFIMAENNFLNNSKYTVTEKMVYLSLCTYAGKNVMCFPGQAGIAKNLGISLRTVNSAIKSLREKNGLVVVEQYTESNRRTVNTYFLADIDSDTGDFIASSLDEYRCLTQRPLKIQGK